MIRIDANRYSLLRATLALGLIALLLTFVGVGSIQAQGAPAAPPAAAPAAPAAEPKPDPGDSSTGAAADVFGMPTNQKINDAVDMTSGDATAQGKILDAAKKSEPFAAGLADAVGHLKVATNFGWTLNTGYLVLFMQAGFALLTTGLIRKKNAGHLMMLNFAAYVIAFIGYYICGFAFQFGAAGVSGGIQVPSNLGGTASLNHWLVPHFLGGTGFFLSGGAYDVGANALILFEVVFMETAGYIIVGAICERITFGAFILCELFIGSILYPIFGCWCWGGGWLADLGNTKHLGHGYVDFAGSTVVHGVGGFAAMALAVILGPRIGKYGPDGKPRAFPAHNIPFVVTGTFILLFGWMGFNPGSTLGATDLRISVVAINTNLAAISGAAVAMIFWYAKFGKPDISMACNGMLAGLVAITAPCAFVNPTSAMIIGALAGLTVCWGVLFNDNVLKIDDPCGAISVHGYCGWLGGICVGIFADGTYGQGWSGTGATEYMKTSAAKGNLLGVTGLLHGDTSQFIAQIIGSSVMVAWAFGLTFIVFKIVNTIKSMRVSREVELEGIDEPEFGTLAYPEDVSFPSGGTSPAMPYGAGKPATATE
jgi:Amt family ammonium transporter